MEWPHLLLAALFVGCLQAYSANRNAEAVHSENLVKEFQSVAGETLQRSKRADPKVYGAYLNSFKSSTYNNFVRPGVALLTERCNKVVSVYAKYRDAKKFKPVVPAFYTKQTEVYGIPVFGSSKVADIALRRMCHVLRFMLERYDFRDALFRFSIRMYIIAKEEKLSDHPDLKGRDDLDDRQRGRGPTLTGSPLLFVAEENLVCDADDLWRNQDVAVHEICHALHRIGARVAVSGFFNRLDQAYNSQKSKWLGTYADENPSEYLAVGCQHYFETIKDPDYDKLNINTRSKLCAFDPKMCNLLKELFPCAAKNAHKFIDRCAWKKKGQNFEKIYDASLSVFTSCPQLSSKSKSEIPTLADCIDLAIAHKGNMMLYGNKCMVHNCPGTSSPTEMGLHQQPDKTGLDVYVNKNPPPVNDLKEEEAQNLSKMCITAASECGVAVSKRKRYGLGSFTQAQCLAAGGCWQVSSASNCYYPVQDGIDKTLDCEYMRERGDCASNKAYMARQCPLSCGWSQQMKNVDIDSLEDMCQDTNLNCPVLTADCHRVTHQNMCQVSCKKCKAPTKIKGL